MVNQNAANWNHIQLHSDMIWVLIQQYGNVKPQIECIIMINKVNNFIECEIQIMMTA